LISCNPWWGLSEKGHTSALAAAIIWALVPVATRFFVLRVDPFVFNAIRFAASGCVALPLFVYAKPWQWPHADQVLLLVCALLAVPGYNIPVSLAARTVTAGQLGLVIATEPIMIAALTMVLQRRSVHWHVIGGSIIALVGVALTSGVANVGQIFRWESTLQALSGAFSWSCYTVLAVRLNQRYGAFGVTGAIVVVGTVVLLAVSWPMMDSTMLPDRGTVAMLGALGVSSSLLGFLLWNYAGARVPSERLGLFLYMIPIVSVYAGVRYLEESLTIAILSGGVLVVLGVWIASRTNQVETAAVTE
jgi:drug/metabolite transporter (DMT)-like permease